MQGAAAAGRGRLHSLVLAIALAALMAAAMAASAEARHAKGKRHVPIVFVHGNSGSAQQFESNAMRFASNGFPKRYLSVYEYDTSGSDNTAAIAGLDDFLAGIRERRGVPKVDVLAHSRGTTVMHEYLSTPERAAGVRRYVNFDGRSADAPPGGVPTLAVWGEGDPGREITGAENVRFANKAHTEVTTSREAFAAVYRFLTGLKPNTKNVLPEPPKRVTVAGRALLFPANAGIEGGQLEVFRLKHASGQRRGAPVYSATLGPDGAFGPVRVHGKRRYEFVVSRPGETTIHNYPEPFERDDHFYRVLSAPALQPFIESGPNHSVVAVTRMREWWGDEDDPVFNDSLTLNGLEVMNPAIAPRDRRVIAVFNFDAGSDGVSDTSSSLSPFNSISFLTGVDAYLPASADASGRIAVVEAMRGKRRHVERINVPNWASDEHAISVYFKDYPAKKHRRKRGRGRA